VQWLLSSQGTGIPTQAPPVQRSSVVQELPSLHATLLLA
jgi:hypothetical protein